MNISFDKPKVIYKDDNGKYKIGISKKRQDGSYENAYFPIEFNKGDVLDNKSVVNIKNAWFTFYKWEYEDKKGTTFFIKCNDYEVVEVLEAKRDNIETTDKVDPYAEFGSEYTLTDENLPF